MYKTLSVICFKLFDWPSDRKGGASMIVHPKARLLPGVSLLLFLSACAWTNMTSQVNPDYATQPVEIMMVYADFSDLGYKKIAEERMCEKVLAETTTRCFTATEMFFSGQTYSDEEILQRLAARQIDSVLTLETTDAGTTTTTTPDKYKTTTTGRVTGSTFSSESTTRQTGGQTYVKPWASFESSLVSVSDGGVIWYATSNTSGNAYAGPETLVASVTATMYSRMVDDGVLVTKPE